MILLDAGKGIVSRIFPGGVAAFEPVFSGCNLVRHKSKILALFFLTGLLLFCGAFQTASAATYLVNTTLDLPDEDLTDGLCAVPHPDYGVDVCTLRAAVMQANHEDHAHHDAGPHHVVMLAGTYRFNPELGGSGAMSGDLDIETHIVIALAEEGLRPVIDADRQDRIFEVHKGKSLRVGYVDLRHGRRVCEDEEPVKFKGDPPKHADGDMDAQAVPDECDDYGGAIRMHRKSYVYLDAVQLYDNEANVGGAIYNQMGTLEMVYGTTLSGNVAQFRGGGIASDDGQVKTYRSYVRDNRAGKLGGGIHLQHGNLRLNQLSEVSGNRTILENGQGGGIYGTQADVMLENTLVAGNETLSNGGGVALLNSIVRIQHSSFQDNVSRDGGGLFVKGHNSQFFMSDSEVTGNEASRGGGIYFGDHDGSPAWIANSSLAQNLAISRGGGMYLFKSLVDLEESELAGNSALLTGGGIELYDDQNISTHLQNGTWNSRLIARDSLIEANEALIQDGGGIHLGHGRNFIELNQGTVVRQNFAAHHGGGILIGNIAEARLIDVQVTQNQAGATGGGIRNQGYLVISSSGAGVFSAVVDNISHSMGAGIFNIRASSITSVPAGVAEIRDSKILRNHSFSSGGGIATTISSVLNLERVDLSENVASYSGGAIYNHGGQLLGTRVSIIGNTAHHSGGALTTFSSATTTLKNSTIAQNQVGLSGGGALMTYAFATTDFINVTVTENSSLVGAGGLQSNSFTATVNLKNSIVAGNTGQYADCLGDFVSLGHNLIGDLSNTNCDLVPQATDLINVSPGLLSAVNALEPGMSHYPLGASSPAIDHADDSWCHNASVYPELAEDQAFCPRVFAAVGGDSVCDIGAAEY